MLLQVNLDRTVHILHSLFSVLINLYSTARRLFACHGDLLREGLPPVVDLPVDAFRVWRARSAIPRADHIGHLKVFSHSVW